MPASQPIDRRMLGNAGYSLDEGRMLKRSRNWASSAAIDLAFMLPRLRFRVEARDVYFPSYGVGNQASHRFTGSGPHRL